LQLLVAWDGEERREEEKIESFLCSTAFKSSFGGLLRNGCPLVPDAD
jgi:hypothetical protein